MQPQQQTVVTTPGFVQPTYITQPYLAAPVVNAYRHKQSAAIGILLIVAGTLSILFNIVDLAVGSDTHTSRYYYGSYNYNYYDLSNYSNGVSGHGFWSGVMLIIAGGFGIGAARHKTRCMINAFLVLAIIGAVVAAIQTIVAATGADNVKRRYGFYFENNYQPYSDQVTAVYAMEILLALLGVAGVALCIWGSILGCMTGDCCASTPAVVTMMPTGQPQVTVVTQQQQQPTQPMQPMAWAQPPPSYNQTTVHPPAQHQQQYPPAGQYPAPGQYPGYPQK